MSQIKIDDNVSMKESYIIEGLTSNRRLILNVYSSKPYTSPYVNLEGCGGGGNMCIEYENIDKFIEILQFAKNKMDEKK